MSYANATTSQSIEAERPVPANANAAARGIMSAVGISSLMWVAIACVISAI